MVRYFDGPRSNSHVVCTVCLAVPTSAIDEELDPMAGSFVAVIGNVDDPVVPAYFERNRACHV